MRFLLGLLLFGQTIFAAPVQQPHLTVELAAEKAAFHSGDSQLWAGIEFHLENGWHVYWQNPGDSGEPPKLDWTLPPGISAGPIQWPAPERISYPPLVNYGYEGKVLLPVLLTAKRQIQGGTIDLALQAKWLVCRESCIPGHAKLSLSLPVDDSKASQDLDWAPDFAKARAALPQALPAAWKVKGFDAKDHFTIRIEGTQAREAEFFPHFQDQIENAAPQSVKRTEQGLRIQIKKSDQLSKAISSLDGVITLDGQAYELRAPLEPAPASDVFEMAPPSRPLWVMLFFALVGGLILNLMPCVFPVLSIKVLSVLGHSGSTRGEVRAQGWAYTLGILVSFWVLVGALLTLRVAGEQLGWGFQLQEPGFLIFLAILFFIFGLNLAGVFEFGSSFAGAGSGLASKGGTAGAFFTGVLATLVATPCTAPFMGTAIGFALSQPNWVAVAIFTVLAIGLALPYLLLSYFTGFARVLPRPGRWMETFKELMAFPLFGTVLWIVWVFGLQTGTSSMFRLLIGLLGIALGAWAIGRWNGKKAAAVAGVLIWVVSTGFVYAGKFRVQAEPTLNAPTMGIQWEKFSPQKVAEYRAQGRPVFVDFTAAWCVSCQVNEIMVFRSPEVAKKIREKNVVMMKADWTTHDPVITQTLASFGKSGVPVYVLYGKNNAPADVLPEIITPSIVLERLNRL